MGYFKLLLESWQYMITYLKIYLLQLEMRCDKLRNSQEIILSPADDFFFCAKLLMINVTHWSVCILTQTHKEEEMMNTD